jgi:hypothetical protein
MKSKILFALLIALLVATVLPVGALAKELREDRIVFGDNFILRSGDELNGNLVVFGGSAILEIDSTVYGDVVILGGNLEADGLITGNVVSIGGNVDLGDNATVQKDIVVFGSNLDQALGASVEGDIVDELTGPLAFNFSQDMRMPVFRLGVNPFFELVWFGLRALLWAILAVVLVLFLPKQFDQIGRTVVRQPIVSGGLGLLTMFFVPVVLVLLLITLICSPLSVLGILMLAVAWAFGLIALGLEVGNRLAKILNQEWAPALSAGVGTLLLVIVLNGLQAVVPCVGWVFPAIAGMVGLGAVILTRFGTQPYPQAAPFGAAPPPPLPAVPAPAVAAPLPEAAEQPVEDEPSQDEIPPAI